MKKKILSLALLYLVSVEALFPAHAFAMEGEQEDVYAWESAEQGTDESSEQQEQDADEPDSSLESVQTETSENAAPAVDDVFNTSDTSNTAEGEEKTELFRYPGEISGQYAVKLIVDREAVASCDLSGYTKTGENEYSAVFDIDDTAILPEVISKPGYEFAGWLDSDTGRFHEGSLQGYGVKTLNAIIKAHVVTVKYVKNAPKGSVIGGTVPSTRVYVYNPDDPPAPTDYCYAGTQNGNTHEFTGWYRTKNCEGLPVTTLFDSAPSSDTTLTLYAGWKRWSYTVSTLQWGSGHTVKALNNGQLFSGNAIIGKKFSTSSLYPEEKTDMVFKGWYVHESTGKWKKIGSISDKNLRDVTLYAKYDAKYTMVLHDTEENLSKVKENRKTFKSVTLPKISKLGWGNGKKFVGWSTGKDSDLVKYGDGKKISFKDDPEGYADLVNAGLTLDLYAVYADENASTRKLMFSVDGKIIREDNKVRMSESFDLSDVAAPEKNGYKFSYWKDAATGKKIKKIKKSDRRSCIRLEAVFTAKKIRITYYNNLPVSVKSGNTMETTAKYTSGKKFSLRKNGFKAEGYEFCCWSADPEGKHPIAWSGSGFMNDDAEDYFYAKVLGKDRTAKLYAFWKPLEYTYSIDDRGDCMFRTVTVSGDDLLSGVLPVSALQWGGHEFVGWRQYQTDSDGILVRNEDGKPVPVNENSDVVMTEFPVENAFIFGQWNKIKDNTDDDPQEEKIEKPEGAISVDEYGEKPAIPDDGIDDREALTNAIAYASRLYEDDGKVHTVYIPGGRYNIVVRPNGRGIDLCGWDMDSKIEQHEFHSDHVKIVMAKDAVLVADYSKVKSDVERFSMFTLEFANDITIEGGVLDGNRSGTSGKKNGGYNLDLSGATNITIKDCTIKNAWTDGIYMGASFSVWEGSQRGLDQKFFMGDKITVDGCTITNSRRNNISVINADNVNVKNCTISDANGESPMCGIDIEPNLTKATWNETEGCYIKGGSAKYIPCQNFTLENTTISSYKGKTGDSYDYFCFNVIYDPRDAHKNDITARDVLVKDCTFNGDCYIGNGEKVTITNTKISGKFGDFFGRAVRN